MIERSTSVEALKPTQLEVQEEVVYLKTKSQLIHSCLADMAVINEYLVKCIADLEEQIEENKLVKENEALQNKNNELIDESKALKNDIKKDNKTNKIKKLAIWCYMALLALCVNTEFFKRLFKNKITLAFMLPPLLLLK